MTDLTIVPVTAENRAAAERLSIFPEQKDFVDTVEECLEEADKYSDWEPVCIYDGKKMVGFAMYGFMRSEKRPRVWFDRFLIDRRYQHHGYGRKAVEEMVNRIHAEFPGKDIYLSAFKENTVAISLYESFGFRMNGELDINDEKVMVLKNGEIRKCAV